MGYLGNHLATVVCAAFAAVLTAMWPPMVEAAPVLDFVFVMAVPIAWFLALTCWLAQKSADYMHRGHGAEKKSSPSRGAAAYAAGGGPAAGGAGAGAADAGIEGARAELAADLERLRGEARLKDTEIARMRQEIADLRTLVQIESLRSELANLRALAAGRR